MGAAAETTKPARETWRDWLPPDAPEPELLTREQLVARLREAGIDADVSDLRYWEYHGILPRPVRQRHDGATRAVYPDWFVWLVGLLREYQGRDNKSLQEIGPALRFAARFLGGRSVEERKRFVTAPLAAGDPEENLAHALYAFTAWAKRERGLASSAHSAVLYFLDQHGQVVMLPSGEGPWTVQIRPRLPPE